MMKKVILSAAIILSTSFVVSANDKEESKLKKDADNIEISADHHINGVRIVYIPVDDKIARLRIKDQSGDLLYSTKFNSKKDWIKRYQLDLVDKKYQVEIEDQNSIYSRNFIRVNGKIQAMDGAVISASRNGHNTVELFVKNHKPQNTVHVKIYNSSDQLVYQDHITSNKSFKRSYDIAQLRPGKIQFEIREGQNKIRKAF